MQPIDYRQPVSRARQCWSVLALVLGACSSSSSLQNIQQPAAALPDGSVQTASQPQTESVPDEPPLACSSISTQIETRALVLINAARAEGRFCGEHYFPAVPALSWNTRLHEAAHAHSEDMARYNFFSHTGSNGSTASERISSTGYSWTAIAENIAAGQADVRSAIDSWVGSPGHCRNLMGADYRDVAVACVEDAGSDYVYYWTQTFGNSR